MLPYKGSSGAAGTGVPMFDLNRVVDHFLEEAVWRCINESQSVDEAIIRNLDERTASVEVRRKEVINWLRSYVVLQGLNRDDEVGVADAILEFADARSRAVPTSEGEIIQLFNELHQRSSSRVRPKRNKQNRSLVSLTSKALWCCYPHEIPLFDKNADSALCVVSRLMGLVRPEDNLPQYNRFVSVWLDVYRRIESAIDDKRLEGYPYKVRVFDRILWIIGQPDYGRVQYKPEG